MAERPMAPDCKSGDFTSTQVRILLCPFERGAGVAQWLELLPSKQDVEGSNPFTRSMDEITMKVCPKCKQSLPLSAFGIRTNGKPQHWCRACHCVYQREHYQKNKEYYYALQEERVERNRRRLREAKAVPCADCGNQYPFYVMDFDHRPGEKKCFNLSAANVQTRLCWAKFEAEIAKCDVVCANCHRERTYQRRQRARKAKRLLDSAT